MYIVINKDLEIFKKCTYPGVLENYYKISNYGKIMNIKKNKIFYPTCINSSGYIHTQLKSSLVDKEYIYLLIERLVAWEYVEGYNELTCRIFVNHKDSDRTHNYYENLEWTTVSENLIHAYNHGLKNPNKPNNIGARPSISGSKNPNVKFTEKIIHDICIMLTNNLTPKQILKKYNATKKDNQQLYTLLMNIKHKKAWKEITSQYKF